MMNECADSLLTGYVFAKQKPLFLRRWWVKIRECKDAVQIDDSGIPACHEFYVPWYAWPLELIYRAVFGKVELA